ncbi:MAG: sulfatase-like hydrolase/transferase [Clostridiaceae bacterium]|nr:sulfatase-like hydrolase/transferase [Clostridiaceae bacterium]MDO4495425.1 sulfatase-like hydrolase/transferase [Clostridiaceae bacterium]
MKKPNIIFYFSDQQRADTAGCYGQKLPVTPNLDSVAKEGTLFENAFTCQPVCGPMRACLQSGVYATQIGCYRNDIALPTDTKGIAHYLKEAGYDTAYIGKWHLASDSEHRLATKATPKERRGGYDYWRAADVLEFTSHGYNGYVFDENGNKLDFKGYRADRINDYAIEYVKKSHDKPFFMFVSHLEPHHQNDHLRFESPKGLKNSFKNYDVPGDLKGTLGDWRLQMPSYLACCNRVDYNFGKLIQTLKDEGIYDNTVIIYTSDHGCHFRTRNAEYKRSCHEASIKVPLVITGGGFTGGGKVSDLVSLIDLPATVLDIAGAEIPEHFMGKSLADKKGHESVFIQISESQIGRAVRTDRWKYSVSAKNRDSAFADSYTEDCLYDLQNDPYEKNNLISDPSLAQTRKELREILLEYMKKAGEPVLNITESTR